MACVLMGSHSFTCTPHVHLLTEWTIPAFAFPAEAGTHLPAPEGWKAELAWVTGWLRTQINVRHRELSPCLVTLHQRLWFVIRFWRYINLFVCMYVLNLDTVAYLSTNHTRCRLTSLIEANALTTTPDHRPILFRGSANCSPPSCLSLCV